MTFGSSRIASRRTSSRKETLTETEESMTRVAMLMFCLLAACGNLPKLDVGLCDAGDPDCIDPDLASHPTGDMATGPDMTPCNRSECQGDVAVVETYSPLRNVCYEVRNQCVAGKCAIVNSTATCLQPCRLSECKKDQLNPNRNIAVNYAEDANGACVATQTFCGLNACKVASTWEAYCVAGPPPPVKCASVVVALDACFKQSQDRIIRMQCYDPIVQTTEGGDAGLAGWLARCTNLGCGQKTVPSMSCNDNQCNGPNPMTSCCAALNACLADK